MRVLVSPQNCVSLDICEFHDLYLFCFCVEAVSSWRKGTSGGTWRSPMHFRLCFPCSLNRPARCLSHWFFVCVVTSTLWFVMPSLSWQFMSLLFRIDYVVYRSRAYIRSQRTLDSSDLWASTRRSLPSFS